MDIEPIFIFYVSRSGSTLLQRVLAAHPGVTTVSEPWILLPLIYSRRQRGVIADYGHPQLVSAVADFVEQLPNGAQEYDEAIRRFVLDLYRRAAGPDARYFVDKSGQSHVAADVMRIFPDAKFVFIWRSPLGIIGSMMDTWSAGGWCPTMYHGDLFDCLPRMVETYAANQDRAHAVNFETLVSGDERSWRELIRYVGIDFEPHALREFSSVRLEGRMGDQTGVTQYSSLSTEPIDKWRRNIVNPVRLEWCRRYLRFLGEERLSVMGYSLPELLAELDEQPFSTDRLPSDIVRGTVDVLKEPVRVRIRRMGLTGPSPVRELARYGNHA
ncbi:MAG TPA: sulfotransferase [Solirubrobacteraceae bacterium]|nr:sulfotransferase [Solirubrobacteraceae bacterium]